MIVRAADIEIEDQENARGGNGKLSRMMYKKASEYGGQIMAMAVMDLEPGTDIGYHIHENDMEMYLMLDGMATVSDNGTISNIVSGDLFITEKGEGHSLRNSTDKNLTFLALVLG